MARPCWRAQRALARGNGAVVALRPAPRQPHWPGPPANSGYQSRSTKRRQLMAQACLIRAGGAPLWRSKRMRSARIPGTRRACARPPSGDARAVRCSQRRVMQCGFGCPAGVATCGTWRSRSPCPHGPCRVASPAWLAHLRRVALPQVPPAGHATTEVELLRQVVPRDTSHQDEENAVEGGAVIALPPGVLGRRPRGWHQRLEFLPNFCRIKARFVHAMTPLSRVSFQFFPPH